MPPLPPLPSRLLTSTPLALSLSRTRPQILRPFTTTPPVQSEDAHSSHYDPPSGWLWGIPPGEKKEKEGIQTWALEEARRRLEAEGILPDPSPKA
ncbi:MAG: hypothetical protein Q9215_002918 [Flavoplaca cf. flavocitrina]